MIKKLDDFCFWVWSKLCRFYRWLKHIFYCDENYMTQPDKIRYCRYCMRMRFSSKEFKKQFKAVINQAASLKNERSIEKLSRDRQARHPDSKIKNQSNNK